MNCRVNDIAIIRMGAFLRPAKDGNVVYLQANSINEGKLNEVLYPELILDKKARKHLLQSGDVLFSCRSKLASVVWNKEVPAVASTSFLVIRLNSTECLPEYLSWYLNRPDIQNQLRDQATGTSCMVFISMAAVEQLEIILPSKESQLAIVKISELRNKELALKQQIEVLKGKQIQHKIFEHLESIKAYD